MTGVFIAVVGASGVGKDAILSAVKPKLETIGNCHFPNRFITRPEDVGGEEHFCLSSTEFVQAVRDDLFSLWWMAHELHYALPESVLETLKNDIHVVANISRHAVEMAVSKFNRVEVIEITAKPETIKERLVDRGRETEAEIMVRQQREVHPDWAEHVTVTKIENESSLSEAADQFLSVVLSLLGEPVPSVQKTL